MELNFGTPVPKAEEGSYPATVTGIESFVIGEGTPDAKTLLRWDASLDGTDDPDFPGTNIIVDGITSLATGPRSKMRAWVTALGANVIDQRVSLAQLRGEVVGSACIAKVVNKDGYSKLDAILPPLRQPVKAPQPVQDAPSAPDVHEGVLDSTPDPLGF
jgi:hypothetical protein